MLKIDMIKKYFNNYNLSKLDEGTEINKKYLTKINKGVRQNEESIRKLFLLFSYPIR